MSQSAERPSERGLATASDASEAARLAVVRSYEILDTAPELPFDEIVELAARACGTSMAAVSLIDADRQWFKARVGLDVLETDRSASFCSQAISQPMEAFVVEDATTDLRFAGNALVTGDPHIRAYAGVPIVGTGGQPLGTLCVIDDRARRFDEREIAALRSLARQVETLLELRLVSMQWRTRADDGRFALAFRRAPIAMNLVGLNGRFLCANEAMARLVGMPTEWFDGRLVQEVMTDGDHRMETDLLGRLVSGDLESAVRPGTVLAVDGPSVHVLATTSAVRDPQGALLFFLTSLEDLSERFRAEDALALTHTALEAIVAADAQGDIVFWNAGATTMFGYRSTEALGRPVAMIMPERLRADDATGIARLGDGGAKRLIGQTVELVAVRANGGEFPVELSLAQWSSRGEIHYTAMLRDITERRRFQDEMIRRADVDTLTGLASADLFAREVAAAVTTAGPSAVILLDLDQFKLVNDSLGYDVGDRALKAVAGRLKHLAPDEVLVARTGGDEFGLLAKTTITDAQTLAAALAQAFHRPIELDGRSITIEASIGIAAVRTDQAARTAIREADTAMYQAKAAGRGKIEVFDDQLRLAALQRLQLEADLREALNLDRLQLHYQIEFDISSGQPHAMEALTRWTRPGDGPVSPAQFIPLAEETGLIVPLGRWVLQRALNDLAWLDRQAGAPRLTVAVNVSTKQLNDPSFVGDVLDALRAAGLDPHRLCLEITESAVMNDPAGAQQKLHQLTALGISIAIDDFGTGYSSLAVLSQLPVSVLKIDKCFVDPLPDAGMPMIQTIVALANTLGLATVAEGIESDGQLAALRDQGVSTAQGFLLAKPMARKDALRLLRAANIAVG